MAGNTTVNTAPAGYSAEIAELIRSSRLPGECRKSCLLIMKTMSIVLELLTQAERAKLYQILDSETLAGILEYSDHLTEYVQELSVRKKVDVFSQMEPSDVVEVLRQLEKGERETLVDLLDPQVRSDVKLLSSFDEDEIGSVMSTNYISVPDHASVKRPCRSSSARLPKTTTSAPFMWWTRGRPFMAPLI